MNSVSLVFAFLALMKIEQHAGSFFGGKPGSCPLYKVMSRSALCDHEKDECDSDFTCEDDLKCCEDERCGVSKCTRPVVDPVPTQRIAGLCPVEASSTQTTDCRRIETKFCFQTNCRRCCTHLTDCNPAEGILVPHEKCKRVTDPPLRINKTAVTVKNGDSVEFKCFSVKENSQKRWSRLVNGSPVLLPTSQTYVVKGDLVLKIENAVVANSGKYLCEIYEMQKFYSKEVQLTVNEPENYKEACLLPKESGPCSGTIHRYYYDVTDNICKKFQYGGCKGNNNNFGDRTECERKCKGTRRSCPSSLKTTVIKEEQCQSNPIHKCSKDEDCKPYNTCCLVQCERKCIDPNKLSTWMAATTEKTPMTKATTLSITTTQKTPFSKDNSLQHVKSEPCGNHRCYFYAKCQTDNYGRKECACPQYCSFRGLFPICGKDMVTRQKKTFNSICFLQVKSCRLQREIKLVALAACHKENDGLQGMHETDLCKLKDCQPYAQCVINRFDGQPQCLCRRFCPFVPNRVCGTDGRTYLNECFLKTISCKKKLYVGVASKGSCVKNNP